MPPVSDDRCADSGDPPINVGPRCHDFDVSLPPTLDEAIRLVRRQHGSITIGDLADAVLDRGWKVDREDLIARIRELYPAPAPKQSAPLMPTAPPPPAKKAKTKGRGVPDPPQRKKKRPKSKSTQEYCPKCHAFVVMTRLEGVTTVAEHQTKKGERCAQSGKPYTPKPLLKPDALDHRVAGSFGTGKRT